MHINKKKQLDVMHILKIPSPPFSVFKSLGNKLGRLNNLIVYIKTRLTERSTTADINWTYIFEYLCVYTS